MTLCESEYEQMPALIAFLNGDVQRHWETQPDLIEQLKAQMVKWYGQAANHPIHIEIQNWSQEKYIEGGPVAVFGPGVLSQMNEPLDTPVGRIYFAGTEFATESQGFMDGAIQSGKRAAQKIFEFQKNNKNVEAMRAEFDREVCFTKYDAKFNTFEASFEKGSGKATVRSNFKTKGRKTQIRYDIYGGSKFQMNSSILFWGLVFVVLTLLLKIVCF